VNPKTALFVGLGIFAAAHIVAWIAGARRARRERSPSDPAATNGLPSFFESAIGFVTNFFDTLGIGSFAPTCSLFKLFNLVPDERIPGTLNVGHTIPTLVEALIFIAIVEVNATTLALMITASVAGAWLGAGVVAGWPRRKVQVGMGIALLAAAAIFMMTNLGWLPGGGDTLSLSDGRLLAGLLGNFVLGALMTIGIGLYAPCMILVSLLGMNPKAAFPIMMGSCAFLMPVASLQFVQKHSYSLRPALGLTLGGVPGVLIAAFIVKSLPLRAVRWLVVAVVVYASVAMLRSAIREVASREKKDAVLAAASPPTSSGGEP
jgi:uncharacterized membrane protein YfcA